MNTSIDRRTLLASLPMAAASGGILNDHAFALSYSRIGSDNAKVTSPEAGAGIRLVNENDVYLYVSRMDGTKELDRLALISAPALASGSGSSHVFHTQPGDGAVAESQKSINQRSLYAQQFNTAQEAIDFAASKPGDRVQIDGGTIAPVTIRRRDVWLEGKGIDTSIISAPAAGGSAITLADRAGSWNPFCVSDMTIRASSHLNSSGIRYGLGQYSPGDEYIGRVIIDRVKFVDLDKCIDKPHGNIGLWIDRSFFNTANYHLFSMSHRKTGGGDEMHPGNMIVTNSYFSGAKECSVYIDGGVSGAGQVSFQNCIFELNPGTVFDVRNFPVSVAPGLNIISCWNELNYTAGTKGGKAWFASFDRVESAYFHDTPVGPMKLRRSHVTTNQCDLTFLDAVDSDDDSTLTHYNARAFSGTPHGLVESIGSIASNVDQINNASFAMPRPVRVGVEPSRTLYSFDGQAPMSLSSVPVRKTTAVFTDPGLPHPFSTSQSMSIGQGQTLVTGDRFAVPADAWMVFQYLARVEDGAGVHVQINGAKAIGGALQITGRQWRCYTTILKNNGPQVEGLAIYHFGQGRETIWSVAGISLAQFESAQDALIHANSKTILLTRRFALDVEETLLIPTGNSVFQLLGTGSIRSISVSAADAGRNVSLIIGRGIQFNRTKNIALSNDIDGGTALTLTLVCDGRQWIETGRTLLSRP